MFKYVGICFKKYATFKGRASRKEFWYFVLFNVLLSLICASIDAALDLEFDLLDSIKSLIMFLPMIAVASRRLHDIDKSGWWQLVPIYNIILWCQQSYIGQNRFDIQAQYSDNTSQNTIQSNEVNQSLQSELINLDLADLEKLAKLKEQGYLTEEEFNIKKKQILGL